MHFKIASSAGVEMGVYEGATPGEALNAMARDAGYASQEDVVAAGIAPFNGTVTETDRGECERVINEAR